MSEVLARSMVVAKRADCVERERPAATLKALVMLTQGCPRDEIEAETGLSGGVIHRLGKDHRAALNEEREKMAYQVLADTEFSRDLLMRRLEQIRGDDEELAKQSPRELATVFGILTDKAERLADRATIRVEVKDGPGLDEVRAMMEELRESRQARGRVVEAEGIEDKEG